MVETIFSIGTINAHVGTHRVRTYQALIFGFIKRVDKGEITTVKDLESWRFER